MMEAGKALELKVQELEAKIRADAEALEAVTAERASHQSMMEAGQALVITVKSLEAKAAQDATTLALAQSMITNLQAHLEEVAPPPL